jgi:FkbM family methyltransferase
MINIFLFNWANSKLPGNKSAYRKYCRRNKGIPHTIMTKHGFTMSLKPQDSVENQLIVYREFEPNLSTLIKSLAHEAKYFIDIGCNVGYFSCLFAKYAAKGSRVLSIDANPAMVDRCRINMDLNKFDGDALNYAIAEHVGEMTLSWPENAPSHASLGDLQGKSLKKLTVPAIPLPHLLAQLSWRHESILKVDIEGFETVLLEL